MSKNTKRRIQDKPRGLPPRPASVVVAAAAAAAAKKASKSEASSARGPVRHQYGGWREELVLLRDEAQQIELRQRRLVSEALAVGVSCAEIGRVLGVSRQSVHRKFRTVLRVAGEQ